MQEQPELGCTLIDLESGDEKFEGLLRELALSAEENQTAWRCGRRYVARLVRATEGLNQAPARPSTDGTVLVTGGLGALGLHIARWLAEQGTAHLLLTGRRGLDTPGVLEAVAELQALGAGVTVAAVDVANRDALRAVIEAVPKELPLRGVVHAAGVLDDGILEEQTAERFAKVLLPKVAGAWNLHELTAGCELEFFVLFSSMVGLLGAAGQSNYAASNAFLDALAAQRRAQNLPGQSLAWGAWSEGGMASGLGAVQQARLLRQGIKALSALEGSALFGRALRRPESQLGVIHLELRAVAQTLGTSVPAVWRSLLRVPTKRAAAHAQGNWAERLAKLPAEQRTEEVRTAVRADVAKVLSLGSPSAVSPERPFSELGLDSLMAVELRNALGQRVGKPLPATLAFDYPTVNALSRWLLQECQTISPAARLDLVDASAPEWPSLPTCYSFQGRDGRTLYGHLSCPAGPGPHPIVIVNPADTGGALDEHGRYVQIYEHEPLLKAGFAVFTVDQLGAKGHGAAYENLVNLLQDDVETLLAAVDYVVQRPEIDPQRLVLFGTSRGAYSGLLALQHEPGRFRAAVLRMGFYDPRAYVEHERKLRPYDSPVLSMGASWDDVVSAMSEPERDPLRNLGAASVPLWIIHGEADRVVEVFHAHRLAEAAQALHIPVNLTIVPGMGHDIHERHAEWPALWIKIVDFLQRHVSTDGDLPPKR
jgi:predicted esterase/NADP-dependent 3-hydroxy acid dehydrogenase YdfG/acyl carrier protein